MAVVLERQEGSRVGRRDQEDLSGGLARLRWLAIAAPVAFLSVVGYLTRGPFHESLHTFPGILYMLLVLAAGVTVFSFAIFELIAGVERQVVQKNRQLEAALAVGRAASSSARLVDMLDGALDAILGVTSAEAAAVWLLDGEHLVRARQRGLAVPVFRERALLSESLDELALGPGERSLVLPNFGAFPLLRRGQIVGVLGVASRDAAALASDVERRLLEGIGEQVAVEIENARLHRRVLDAAVVEERERLAHELHDGLAQMLGYVNTQTLAIKKLLESGRSGEAEAEVAEMETAARRVYMEVRQAILGLRPSTDGLLGSLRAYSAGFGRLGGITVELEVGERVEALEVSVSTEIQLVRIVQEALANVRKHAGARSARVTVTADDDMLLVVVEDDGSGFEVDQRRRTGWPHFGLQTMRERAEAIGGRLDVVSAPGAGTTVTVRIPLEYATAVGHARLAG